MESGVCLFGSLSKKRRGEEKGAFKRNGGGDAVSISSGLHGRGRWNERKNKGGKQAERKAEFSLWSPIKHFGTEAHFPL